MGDMMCEGKDYIQLFFHDTSFGKFENSATSDTSTFQNPDGSDYPAVVDHMYNGKFFYNQSSNNTNYCFTSRDIDSDINSIVCDNNYSAASARGSATLAPMYRFVPFGSPGGKECSFALKYKAII